MKKHPISFGSAPCFRAHGRHFHRLAHVHDMVDQVRKADLDQPHNRRAGRGDDRPGKLRVLQPFLNGLADDVRAAGHLINFVKAHPFQSAQHLGNTLQVAELAVQAGRGQRDFVFELGDGTQRICHRDLRVVGTDADALAAVDTALVNDMRPAAPHPDRFRRAALQAVCASPALLAFQAHRMKSFFVHGLCCLSL